MDGRQIEFISNNDPYISKYDPKVILDTELVAFEPEKIYFILLTGHSGKKVVNRKRLKIIYGHWVLVETLTKNDGKCHKIISLYDPLAQQFPKSILKIVLTYCETYNSKMYINPSIAQLPYSSICGPICLFVAMLISRPGNSYKNIKKVKLNHNLRFIAKYVPSLISHFLPKGQKKMTRFSLDFFLK